MTESEFKEVHFEKVLAHIRAGHTNIDACNLEGVVESRFYEWRNNSKELKEEYKKAHQQRHETRKGKARGALMRLIEGEESTEEVKEYHVGEDGIERLKTRTEKTKRTSPNAAAVIFFLKTQDEDFAQDETVVQNNTIVVSDKDTEDLQARLKKLTDKGARIE